MALVLCLNRLANTSFLNNKFSYAVTGIARQPQAMEVRALTMWQRTDQNVCLLHIGRSERERKKELSSLFSRKSTIYVGLEVKKEARILLREVAHHGNIRSGDKYHLQQSSEIFAVLAHLA